MSHAFTPNKFHSHLLNVEPSNLVLLKTYNAEFHETTITFTDENGILFETEGKVNLTFLVNK